MHETFLNILLCVLTTYINTHIKHFRKYHTYTRNVIILIHIITKSSNALWYHYTYISFIKFNYHNKSIVINWHKILLWSKPNYQPIYALYLKRLSELKCTKLKSNIQSVYIKLIECRLYVVTLYLLVKSVSCVLQNK